MNINSWCKNSLVVLLLLLLTSCSFRSSPIELIPLERGPYAVGSSNVEVTSEFEEIGDETIEKYLSGDSETLESIRYITDLLKYPESAWIVDVDVPDEPDLYGHVSGISMPVFSYIVYPTSNIEQPNNYVFPFHNGTYGAFENMLAVGEKPDFADPDERYPLIIDSHGFTAHGMYDVGRVHELASQGYIVAVIFYGDRRTFVGESQTIAAYLRPLFTKAVLDSLLNSDEFGPHIDSNNIAMAGFSAGGTTAFAMSGGKLFGKPTAVTDTRIKANALAAPWVGNDELIPFGPNNSGLAEIDTPTLTLFATNDEAATPSTILAAVNQLKGPTYVIELVDQPHVFEPGSWVDRKNWEALFFAAYLKKDPVAMKLLTEGSSMKGGNRDIQLFEYQ